MKELQNLIKRVEAEINKTPSGNLRNLLCDANILLQKQALILPVVSNQRELLNWLAEEDYLDNYKDELDEIMIDFGNRPI